MGGRELVVVGERPDVRIAAVTGSQSAHISRGQLVAIEFTPAMIKTRVRRGQLSIAFRGVYTVAAGTAVALGPETAALLAVGARGALGYRSAAAVWAMLPAAPADVEVVVATGAGVRSRPGIHVHRSVGLSAHDVRRCRGLPVTTPARTLIDLADLLEPRMLEQALDEALHRRLVSPTKIREAAARAPGRRGGPLLLTLVGSGRTTGFTRGEAEERLLGILHDAGIGSFEGNAKVGPYTVDFLWRAAGVVVEVDSYQWHSGPAAFKRDRRKDAYLRDRGLDVIRVTWEMMDAPLALVARIARAITEGVARNATRAIAEQRR